MKFTETPLAGAYVIDIEPVEDDRGFFAREWCAKEFESQGLSGAVVQANVSFNRHRGTLRGMHWQEAPCAENKLVRCVRGAIFDVAVDLRSDSPTYLQWFGIELDQDNHRMLLVPEGFAHGFQTLMDATEVHYQVTHCYAPESERGARYDDPSFEIQWPLSVADISEKDAAWPDFV